MSREFIVINNRGGDPYVWEICENGDVIGMVSGRKGRYNTYEFGSSRQSRGDTIIAAIKNLYRDVKDEIIVVIAPDVTTAGVPGEPLLDEG